ncbi:OLC1v1022269C1 [Oldenlandia corymbosa var. corymbosa]|uniref:OLC1v1022269C1 n=1 Tax=Oldenlandia corymbosa var. corymbosa TaxID=529605 RepID=A0AAV1BXN0_OLDCO|nr:OLC1v1022269C1 [Oldenlandia corymbosa var. corymbosa]
MEPSKTQTLHTPFHTTEGGEEEQCDSHLQGHVVDPLGYTNGHLESTEQHHSLETKPVLNYSIQTGEEFAFEFIRDRGIPRKASPPNSNGGDPTFAPSYMELKGLLGVSCSESESGSDISMLPILGNGSQRIPHSFQRNFSLHSSYHSLAQASSGASSDSSKLKFCCSFGGRILPRPSDGKLRYAGGETRIICVSKDIQWQELLQKTRAIYDETYCIKYQLPGEELDALVSVSCDEDLQNMMEECKVLDDGRGSYKLRLFLFSAADLDDNNFFSSHNVGGDSEFQFLVAINGLDIGSRKSPNLNLGNLDGSKIETNQSLRPGYVVASAPAPFVEPSLSPAESSQPGLQTVPKASEPESQFYHGNMLDTSQVRMQPVHYDYNLHPSQLLPVEGAAEPMHLERHNWDEQKRPEGKLIDATGQEPQIMNPNDLCNDSKDFIYVDERSTAVPSKLNEEMYSVSSKDGEKSRGPPVQMSSLLDGANPVEVLKPSGTYYNGGDGAAVTTESGAIDLSYFEPPAASSSQRVFQSERIPREQAELLHRLSKSDDLHNSPFVMTTHSRSNIPEQQDLISEPVERSQQGIIPTEHLGFVDFQRTKNEHTEHPESKPSVLDFVDSKDHGEYNGENMLGNNMPEPGSTVTLVNRTGQGDFLEDSDGNHLPGVHRVENISNETKHVYQRGTSDVSKAEQPDILIDINDRFPRDILSDIFSKAILSNSPPSISPLQNDGAGVSLNMKNHDPKSWSFFQKLAGNDFARKDLFFGQDQLGYSDGILPKVDEEAPIVAYGFDPLVGNGVSQNHVENEWREVPNRPENLVSDSDYPLPSHEQIGDPMPYDDSTENTRVDLEYEDGQNFGFLHLDPSLGIDLSSLQLIMNEDLEELRELGAGSFGTVYHGKWRGTDVAIKRIKKSCFTGRPSEQERLAIEFWREAEILSKLHHPNVVAFYGVVQDGPGGTLATVTEFMVDGSLRHVLLRKDRHLDRRKRLIIAMDAAFGMEYLHSKNIVHFDLKCDNLLVNLKDPSRPICKVGDFGLSKMKRNTLVSGGVRGTLPWMAPELLNGSSNKVSEKVDVFSFGIVLWEILTGEEPYANMHYGAIIGGIVSNQLRPTIPSFCDPEWRRLMEQCWAPDPIARPSFREIAARLRSMSAAATQNKAAVNRTSN